MLSNYPHYIPLYLHHIYIYTYIMFVCVPLYLHYSMFYAIPIKSHYIPMTSYHISIIYIPQKKNSFHLHHILSKYQISPTMCVEATKTQVFGSDSAGGIRMHAGCHRSPFRGQGQSSHATATGLDPGAVAFVAFVARSRNGCVWKWGTLW
jgi:hypothetical protein